MCLEAKKSIFSPQIRTLEIRTSLLMYSSCTWPALLHGWTVGSEASRSHRALFATCLETPKRDQKCPFNKSWETRDTSQKVRIVC